LPFQCEAQGTKPAMRSGYRLVPSKITLQVTVSFFPPLDVLLSPSFSRSGFERLLPHLPDLNSLNVWSVLKSFDGQSTAMADAKEDEVTQKRPK
jgi:hypothetical protein